jgi:hypothetical protein
MSHGDDPPPDVEARREIFQPMPTNPAKFNGQVQTWTRGVNLRRKA